MELLMEVRGDRDGEGSQVGDELEGSVSCACLGVM